QEIAHQVQVPDRQMVLAPSLDGDDSPREVGRDIPLFARADQEEGTATDQSQPVRLMVQPAEVILRQLTDGVRTRRLDLTLLGDRSPVTTGPILGTRAWDDHRRSQSPGPDLLEEVDRAQDVHFEGPGRLVPRKAGVTLGGQVKNDLGPRGLDQASDTRAIE